MKLPVLLAHVLLASLSVVATASVHAGDIVVGVRDQQSAALEDAVVSLTPASGGLHASAATAKIDQRGLKFVPHVLAVQAGTAVSFPNSDQVRHHVYSFSPVRPFELRLYKDTPAEPVVFDQVGVATLGCNIHDWMIAYVVIVDTPYFATTGVDGEVRIALPPGDYDLRVWHARGDEVAMRTSERIRVESTGLRRDIVREIRAAEPERAPPSELEQKFRRYQKKLDGDE